MRKEGEVEAGDLLRRVKERGKVIKEWCCVIRELITFSSAVSTEARSRGTWTNHSSAVGEFHSFGIQGVEMGRQGSISTHSKKCAKTRSFPDVFQGEIDTPTSSTYGISSPISQPRGAAPNEA